MVVVVNRDPVEKGNVYVGGMDSIEGSLLFT